jgi:hypothetical protein
MLTLEFHFGSYRHHTVHDEDQEEILFTSIFPVSTIEELFERKVAAPV